MCLFAKGHPRIPTSCICRILLSVGTFPSEKCLDAGVTHCHSNPLKTPRSLGALILKMGGERYPWGCGEDHAPWPWHTVTLTRSDTKVLAPCVREE